MLLPVKIQSWTHEDKQGITSNGLVSDPFSISCYVMPNRVILHMCSVQVAVHVFMLISIAHTFISLARVVNAHALDSHCIPQIVLATFEVRKYF